MKIDFVLVTVLFVVFNYEHRDSNPSVKFPAYEDLI